MIDNVILTLAAFLLSALLYFEKRASIRGIVLTKPFLSALFIAVALSGSRGDPIYFGLVLAGLFCCLAGDVFLMYSSSKRLFLSGLISFLAGHILYTVAFFVTSEPGLLTWVIGACCLATSVATFAWLRPYLGGMRIPIIAYIVVITAMVIGASSLLGDEQAGGGGRILVFSGAFLFYVSDLFVARQRFVVRQYVNRLLGLPLYYAAQFMIAFSIRLL